MHWLIISAQVRHYEPNIYHICTVYVLYIYIIVVYLRKALDASKNMTLGQLTTHLLPQLDFYHSAIDLFYIWLLISLKLKI